MLKYRTKVEEVEGVEDFAEIHLPAGRRHTAGAVPEWLRLVHMKNYRVAKSKYKPKLW